jgi:multiple sugar transport system permease protein
MEFPGKKLLVVLVMITLMTRDGDVRRALRARQQAGPGEHVPRPRAALLVTPIRVFLMPQFMLGIPDLIMEAARIDGADEFRIFLCKVGLAATERIRLL